MTQYSTQTNDFLNSNRNIYEVVYTANGANGDIVSTDNRLPVDAVIKYGSSNTVSSGNWGLDVALGNIPGYSNIHKFGAVPSMSQNQTGSVWDKDDTIYPWSAWDTAGSVTIATTAVNGSTSTLDDGLMITLVGLNDSYEAVTETLTISGSSATGTQIFKRLYRAYVTDGASSNQTQIRVSRGATEVLRINIGKSQTLMAIYTVPAGYTGYLLQGTASVQYGADATGDMFVRYFGQDTFRVGHSFEVSGAGGQYIYPFSVPVAIPEKSDIDVRVAVRSNNARVTAAFDLLLIQN